jgi:hypothetical protein
MYRGGTYLTECYKPLTRLAFFSNNRIHDHKFLWRSVGKNSHSTLHGAGKRIALTTGTISDLVSTLNPLAPAVVSDTGSTQGTADLRFTAPVKNGKMGCPKSKLLLAHGYATIRTALTPFNTYCLKSHNISLLSIIRFRISSKFTQWSSTNIVNVIQNVCNAIAGLRHRDGSASQLLYKNMPNLQKLIGTTENLPELLKYDENNTKFYRLITKRGAFTAPDCNSAAADRNSAAKEYGSAAADYSFATADYSSATKEYNSATKDYSFATKKYNLAAEEYGLGAKKCKFNAEDCNFNAVMADITYHTRRSRIKSGDDDLWHTPILTPAATAQTTALFHAFGGGWLRKLRYLRDSLRKDDGQLKNYYATPAATLEGNGHTSISLTTLNAPWLTGTVIPLRIAYDAWIDPETRNKLLTAAKHTARKNYEPALHQLVACYALIPP